MITGAFWFYSFLFICIYFLCSFTIYHYCIICLGSYLFMVFHYCILSLFIIYYWFHCTCDSHIESVSSFCVCCYFGFCLSSLQTICLVFFLCSHKACIFCHSFLFLFSHTFISFSFLTSIFF